MLFVDPSAATNETAKRLYDRDFLMSLRFAAPSIQPPNGLPILKSILNPSPVPRCTVSLNMDWLLSRTTGRYSLGPVPVPSTKVSLPVKKTAIIGLLIFSCGPLVRCRWAELNILALGDLSYGFSKFIKVQKNWISSISGPTTCHLCCWHWQHECCHNSHYSTTEKALRVLIRY